MNTIPTIDNNSPAATLSFTIQLPTDTVLNTTVSTPLPVDNSQYCGAIYSHIPVQPAPSIHIPNKSVVPDSNASDNNGNVDADDDYDV